MGRIFLFLSFVIGLSLHSQDFRDKYPQDYFRSPLDIPLYLSGNFAELRSNHFHAGLDIKTQGFEGQKIYAVADGYISRIKVSPYGYGKAIYVTHPNGYTSVYGHLQKYSDKIAELVKEKQYESERFDVHIFPSPFSIPVKKGEIIAYSGNSGGSAGPHLHFEIRETASEHPVNPLFFGFDIKDDIPPQIYKIAIYPLDDESYINGANKMKYFQAKGSYGKYKIDYPYPILLQGTFGFGIMAVDRMNSTHNKYGLHNLQLYFDEEKVYEQEINEFAFHEGRYINSHVDYAFYALKGLRFQKNFVDPGNRLRIYKSLVNEGKIVINDEQEHTLKYIASDLYGNEATIEFTIEGKKYPAIPKSSDLSSAKIKFLAHDRSHSFIEDEVLVRIPKGLLYDDIYFEYRKEEGTDKTISPIYWLHNRFTPLHSYMTVAIRKEGLPSELKSKALIVSTTNGRNWYAEGGSWKGDQLSVRTRSFGGYAIAIDSTAPSITPVNIYPGANMNKKWSIQFKIDDDLSGIGSYRAEVDGKWILMDYDAKNRLITHYFDGRIGSGEHELVLKVKDERGNLSTYTAKFRR
ncbi:MAG: peptidase M23 [Flavobacteriales bacterium]|nr:peptidase M23 [Flavobacteriales bacterium]